MSLKMIAPISKPSGEIRLPLRPVPPMMIGVWRFASAVSISASAIAAQRAAEQSSPGGRAR